MQNVSEKKTEHELVEGAKYILQKSTGWVYCHNPLYDQLFAKRRNEHGENDLVWFIHHKDGDKILPKPEVIEPNGKIQ